MVDVDAMAPAQRAAWDRMWEVLLTEAERRNPALKAARDQQRELQRERAAIVRQIPALAQEESELLGQIELLIKECECAR